MKSSRKNPAQTTFVGGGIDAASWLVTIGTSRIPHKPYAATWPFARLSIGKESAAFRIIALPVHKSVRPSGVTIGLSKLGYLYFRTTNKTNDFSFGTLKLDAVMRELRRYGYHLDESCSRNMHIAKISLRTQGVLSVVLPVAIIILGVVRPNG